MASIGDIFDSGGLSAQGRQGTTVQTFLLSLAAGVVLFGVQFSGFAIFRNYLWAKRIYQPRSFLVPLKDRVKPPPNNLYRWITTVFNTSSEVEVLHKAGMDAYFFLRYLRMCLNMFLPLALIVLPILIPLNAIHGKSTHTFVESTGNVTYNVTGLDTLAWSNVSPDNTGRYWAHLILAICIIAWVCFLFHRELMHYIIKRQEHLGSASHRLKASSTTVLITDIPKELCNTEALTDLYDDFPGGIRRMWINKNYDELVKKDKLRRHYEDLLENAETNLIRMAVKQSRKSGTPKDPMTIGAADQESETELNHETTRDGVTSKRCDTTKQATIEDCQRDLEYDLKTKALWTRYISPKQRQTMRIPSPHHKTAFKIPLFGRFFATRVDTIYYCRRELARLNQEMDYDIDHSGSLSPNGSAFIQFNTQKAAHLACQAVAATRPRQMLQRTVEISPADINWFALSEQWGGRALRLLSFITLIVLFVFLFGCISFFTGILSRLSTLAGSVHWLRFLDSFPRWLISFIQGTLPPVILVILLSGPTPILLRAMTNKTRAAITGSQGERSLQYWYFIFLLLELFIIPSVSSGLTSTVRQLVSDWGSVPNILATNLPTASNYFFSFLIVQALSISASSICQSVRLFNFYVIGRVNTPDALFAKLTFTHLTRIGSNIPWYTTFVVIGLVYSVVAPLISLFMLLTFGLFWIVIKNNLLFVVRTGTVDSGALWFPHAITQTFTGLYFMEICLVGLFFLVRDAKQKVACYAQAILMIICLVCTILYQIWLTNNFAGLIKYAPLSLEGLGTSQNSDYELQRLAPKAAEVAITDRHVDASPERIPSSNPEKFLSPLNREVSIPKVNSNHRDRRMSTRSTAIADRSKDMTIQKEHDMKGAKHILARLNRPLDEARLASLEADLAAAEARIGNILLPRTKDIEARMMNDPISKVIMQHNDELEDLTSEERDMLISVAFTHPVLREAKPTVWIPRDELGISDDEMRRMRELSEHLVVDNRGAFFNKKDKVDIDRAPPDMSEFALVMAEL